MKIPLIMLMLSGALLSGCCGWRGWDHRYRGEDRGYRSERYDRSDHYGRYENSRYGR
ncbi:MAG: hypothetical protein V4525_14265 [Pseudomonadota bacterium]